MPAAGRKRTSRSVPYLAIVRQNRPSILAKEQRKPMHPFSTKLDFKNSHKRAHVVAVEPWGHDYTLMPNESLSIIAFGDLAVPWFEFECGHQRLTK